MLSVQLVMSRAVNRCRFNRHGLSISTAIGDQLSASSQLIDRSHDMLTGFVWYNCSLYLAISQVIFTVFEVYLLCT